MTRSVLFINRVYPPEHGATGRILRDLAQELARSGWKVSVLSASGAPRRFRENGVTVQHVKGAARQTVWNYSAIWLRLMIAGLKAPRADIVVTMTDPPMLAFAGAVICWKKQSNHVHWAQDLYPDLFPVLGLELPAIFMRSLRRLMALALKKTARVVVIGRCMAARTARYVGADRITIIPNWPDPEFRYDDESAFLHKPPPAATDVKPVLIDASPKFRVLYAGNLGRAHSVATILEAAATLQKSNPEIEFVFVGKGPGQDKLATARLRWNLDNIRLLPPQPDTSLRRIMESGDIHLVSMKNEAAGLVVPSKLYAAIAAQRPCILIGPEDTETADTIRRFSCGDIVATGNGKGLAQVILQYREDGDKWLAAHRGAVQAAGHCTAETSMRAWSRLLENVLTRSR